MIRPELRKKLIPTEILTERDQTNLERLDIFLRHTLGLTREEAGFLLTKLTYTYLISEGIK